MARIVSCPQCNKPAEWNGANPWRPFCSERCRLIDLGNWASDRYRIEGKEEKKDEEREEPE